MGAGQESGLGLRNLVGLEINVGALRWSSLTHLFLQTRCLLPPTLSHQQRPPSRAGHHSQSPEGRELRARLHKQQAKIEFRGGKRVVRISHISESNSDNSVMISVECSTSYTTGHNTEPFLQTYGLWNTAKCVPAHKDWHVGTKKLFCAMNPSCYN